MKILAFFAHPDDETMFLGGTLAHLSRKGAEIHFLCATRGEGGERGDPPVCSREELGVVREAELTCAVQVLSGESLRFLDYTDPLVGPEGELFPYTEHTEDFVRVIRKEIEKVQPEVIFTHGPEGEYGHPGHVVTYLGLREAARQIPEGELNIYAPSWLSRETGKFTPVPDYLLDVKPVLEKKIQAALCHRSQHGLFRRHGESRFGRPVTVPELIKDQEGLVRLTAGSTPDPLLPWIEPLRVVSD